MHCLKRVLECNTLLINTLIEASARAQHVSCVNWLKQVLVCNTLDALIEASARAQHVSCIDWSKCSCATRQMHWLKQVLVCNTSDTTRVVIPCSAQVCPSSGSAQSGIDFTRQTLHEENYICVCRLRALLCLCKLNYWIQARSLLILSVLANQKIIDFWFQSNANCAQIIGVFQCNRLFLWLVPKLLAHKITAFTPIAASAAVHI